MKAPGKLNFDESGQTCRHNCRTAAAGSDVSTESGQGRGLTKVYEYLVVFALKPELPDGQGVLAIETLWSLQFQLPGCIASSGGLVEPSDSMHTDATHALHMRFGSRQQADSFRLHPAVRDAFRTEFAPHTVSIVEVLFEAEVESEIEPLFRKGSEWESGVEHLLLLRQTADGADQLVQRLAVLAVQSQSEALQACFGKVLHHQHKSQASAADCALMVRFPTRQQQRWFTQTPPHQALLAGDERLPVAVVMALSFETLTTERQQSKAPPLGVKDL